MLISSHNAPRKLLLPTMVSWLFLRAKLTSGPLHLLMHQASLEAVPLTSWSLILR